MKPSNVVKKNLLMRLLALTNLKNSVKSMRVITNLIEFRQEVNKRLDVIDAIDAKLNKLFKLLEENSDIVDNDLM